MAGEGTARTKSPALLSFERMLTTGRDSALLRYSIGNEYAKVGAWTEALASLEKAVRLDPTYTAAWKLYAKALESAGRSDDALDAYRRGIVCAKQKGDRQAEKEMTVFARRIERATGR